MIKGVTFDLWDTVFVDDTDEPKRKAAGRPTKLAERRQYVHEYLEKHQSTSRQLVDVVYDAADSAFKKVWHDQHVTWTVRERLQIVLQGLHRDLPENDMARLVKLHEEMELEFRPNFVPGIHDALKTLHGKYKLGIISDAIFSPGRCLRTLLRDEGLLDYFDIAIFSDEFGFSKPEPRVFEAAWKALKLGPAEVVHIGDREHNDILGPQSVGMHCLLCTAALDRGSTNTHADAVFDDYAKLPGLLDSLNNRIKG
jgi:HAD superfamily hydrolase (TIGR01549 family)